MRVLFLSTLLPYCAQHGIAIPTRSALDILTSTAQLMSAHTHREAMPKPYVKPWSEVVPLSKHVFEKRQTSTASPSTTTQSPIPGVKPGQIVVASTKLSTLPPAICGFVTYDNSTGTGIGMRLSTLSSKLCNRRFFFWPSTGRNTWHTPSIRPVQANRKVLSRRETLTADEQAMRPFLLIVSIQELALISE